MYVYVCRYIYVCVCIYIYIDMAEMAGDLLWDKLLGMHIYVYIH
jgi:hypothetical protein